MDSAAMLHRLLDEGGIFYHGSRGGIVGEISPHIGRVATDFGQGFYMGTDSLQAKGLVAHDMQPVAYALKVDLSGVSPENVLVLDEMDWVYTVLHNRRNCPGFTGTWQASCAARGRRRQGASALDGWSR